MLPAVSYIKVCQKVYTRREICGFSTLKAQAAVILNVQGDV